MKKREMKTQKQVDIERKKSHTHTAWCTNVCMNKGKGRGPGRAGRQEGGQMGFYMLIAKL